MCAAAGQGITIVKGKATSVTVHKVGLAPTLLIKIRTGTVTGFFKGDYHLILPFELFCNIGEGLVTTFSSLY